VDVFFSLVTVSCQWLTIRGIRKTMPMDNKSSILNTDVAFNSMDRHNVEWISGVARIPFL
jgi:hypothetical protein